MSASYQNAKKYRKIKIYLTSKKIKKRRNEKKYRDDELNMKLKTELKNYLTSFLSRVYPRILETLILT